LGESVPVWAGLYRTSAFTGADIDCAGDAVLQRTDSFYGASLFGSLLNLGGKGNGDGTI